MSQGPPPENLVAFLQRTNNVRQMEIAAIRFDLLTLYYHMNLEVFLCLVKSVFWVGIVFAITAILLILMLRLGIVSGDPRGTPDGFGGIVFKPVDTVFFNFKVRCILVGSLLIGSIFLIFFGMYAKNLVLKSKLTDSPSKIGMTK